MSTTLRCAGCGKEPATMQCPKCKELGHPPTYYCEQACFKKSWATHKAVHSQPPPVKTMADLDKAMFKFTGPIRPQLTTATRKVPESIARPDYIGHPEGASVAEERAYRTNRIPKWKGKELDTIAEIARLSREVLDIALPVAAKVGTTGDEIDRIVHDATVERGLYPSPNGYNQFPKSVCVSPNEIICHGIPDSRPFEEGDIVNLDVSCFGLGGYHGDLNETVFVGKPSPTSQKLVHATYEAMMAGFSIVKPGTMYKHIGDAVTGRADQDSFSVVRSVTGHGIGALFHTNPNVPHYRGNKAIGVMQEGHVFTIEPMLCEGGWEDVTWPDNWTIATADGKRSAMFEHTCVVTETGNRLLTVPNDRPYVPFYRTQLDEWNLMALDKPASAASEQKQEEKQVDEDEAA